MAIDNKYQRCEEDDPNRCQAVGRNQCPFLAVPGQTNCVRHGGELQNIRAEKKAVHSYNLTKYQSRLNEHSDHDTVKSLRGEIGILRMTLESLLNNQIKDDGDIFIYSGPVLKIVDGINKVVSNCDRIETKMGMLLDRAAMIVIAGKIVEIVSRFIEDPEDLELISTEIIATISSANETGAL